PLCFIAEFIGQEIMVNLIRIAKVLINLKKEEQEMESKDIMVYDFISKQDSNLSYHSVKRLTDEFREFSGEIDEDVNSKWFGRALKRLNLVIDKRRVKRGVEVSLNVVKAQEKLKIFRVQD
ncbi:unnamed protein product, partial [marine sediment metagenome]